MLRRIRKVEGLESAVDHAIIASDGVRLAAYSLRPEGPVRLHIVLCHGFTNHSRRPQLVRIASRLESAGVAVTAFDFRGHGRSQGESSVGGDGELADLDAVVAHVRRTDPDAQVAVIGFSMGASVAIRHASLGQHRPDLLVSVSAVSRWYVRDSTSMRRVHWLLESRLGPVTSRLALRTRLGGPWATRPVPPIEAIAALQGIPTLLVHGDRDIYFGPDHARALQAAAPERPELWVVAGFGHAEGSMTAGLVDRIRGWLMRALDVDRTQHRLPGAVPARNSGASA
ncbi:alpha/beta hydrolase [Antricoccus suffuscus]|nr:alpha/beta fold hydrolase [Antricoccus suffuscus]